MNKKTLILIISIIIPLLVGFIGNLLGNPSMGFELIKKPSFMPPKVLFPIVWTILYVLMGISYGILKSNNLTDEKVDSIYYLQLLVNALWSIFFFVFN